MLIVSNLSKKFGKIKAVNDLSFQVKKGETFAFLGTNGAGKSTVIYMLLHLLTPTGGTIKFSDESPPGVVFQSHRLDESLTIEENLMVRAKLYGYSKKEAKKRIDELLAVTHLSTKRDRLYGKCSGGEKRKTDIIRALIHQPSLLILDEPTTGLDAESREEIWNVLRNLQVKQGLTIFLTTHYIEEAENSDYVLIMHEGKIEVEGTPNLLKEKYSRTILRLYPKDAGHYRLADILHEHRYSFDLEKNSLIITLSSSIAAIPILQAASNDIERFTISEASLEHVFLQVTKQIKSKVKQ